MEVRGKYKGNSTCRAKALRLGVSRQTSRRRTNFPTKELRSKRRISPCIFQAHQYLDLPTSRSRIASREIDLSPFSLGPVYDFVCISFRTDNLNCFRAS